MQGLPKKGNTNRIRRMFKAMGSSLISQGKSISENLKDYPPDQKSDNPVKRLILEDLAKKGQTPEDNYEEQRAPQKDYLEGVLAQQIEIANGKDKKDKDKTKTIKIKPPVTKHRNSNRVTPPPNPPEKVQDLPVLNSKDKTTKESKEATKVSKNLDTLAGDTKGTSSIPTAPNTELAVISFFVVAIGLGIYLYLRKQ